MNFFIIKRLFENSSKNLTENDRRLFQIDYKQEYNLIKKDTMTKDYINDIIILLCKNINLISAQVTRYILKMDTLI